MNINVNKNVFVHMDGYVTLYIGVIAWTIVLCECFHQRSVVLLQLSGVGSVKVRLSAQCAYALPFSLSVCPYHQSAQVTVPQPGES